MLIIAHKFTDKFVNRHLFNSDISVYEFHIMFPTCALVKVAFSFTVTSFFKLRHVLLVLLNFPASFQTTASFVSHGWFS